MTFAPALPLSGYGGWTFLKRTAPAQQAVFNGQSQQKRDEDYFRANIGKINSADELVNDKRLLRVALGAYGLDADINSKAFIRKVLSDSTLREGTLPNRLADKQYLKLSAAFGFGDFTVPRSKLSDFADKTLALYRQRGFEVAVGRQDGDLRLALNLERELPALVSKAGSDDLLWFTVMGNAPLRQVFQQALGLPDSFGSVDLDRQLATFKDRAERQFGSDSLRQFADPRRLDDLLRRFFARSGVNLNATAVRGASALTLLQTTGR
jgi:Protein of unknown function (DUF1217)